MLDSNFLMAQNQFDSIDLSDNNVIILEGFPKLPRLKTLILNNNRITRISRHLEGDCLRHVCLISDAHTVECVVEGGTLPNGACSADSIPNLMQLVLTNNRLKNLAVRPLPPIDSARPMLPLTLTCPAFFLPPSFPLLTEELPSIKQAACCYP